MDKFLQYVGAAGLAIAVFLVVATTLQAPRGPNAIMVFAASMSWALPAIVGSVMIAAFGSMLEHLKAIRAATERQADLFQDGRSADAR